jgi:hypothetical protein
MAMSRLQSFSQRRDSGGEFDLRLCTDGHHAGDRMKIDVPARQRCRIKARERQAGIRLIID